MLIYKVISRIIHPFYLLYNNKFILIILSHRIFLKTKNIKRKKVAEYSANDGVMIKDKRKMHTHTHMHT